MTQSCVWLPVPFTNHEKLFHGAPCHQKMQPCSTKNKQFSVNRGRMPRMSAQRSLTAGTWVTWTCRLEGKFEEQLNFEDHNDFQILLISTVNLNSKIWCYFPSFSYCNSTRNVFLFWQNHSECSVESAVVAEQWPSTAACLLRESVGLVVNLKNKYSNALAFNPFHSLEISKRFICNKYPWALSIGSFATQVVSWMNFCTLILNV